jgi:hypothetical protein
MPIPCSNCIRFHYGPCRDPMKQCFLYGGYQHLDHYCPNRRGNIRHTTGEQLAGTRKWCAEHELNNDPRLKARILSTLKTEPGSSIWLDRICIYGGSARHFTRDDQERGRMPERPLEERITRARSRSPKMEDRPSPRSRSPLCRYERSRSPELDYGPQLRRSPVYERRSRYRSRSPTLRQRIIPPQRRPEPAPASKARTFARGSNAIPVVPRAPSVALEQTRLFPAVKISSSHRVPGFVQLPSSSAAPSGPLQQNSSNVPKSKTQENKNPNPFAQSNNAPKPVSQSSNAPNPFGQPSNTPKPASQSSNGRDPFAQALIAAQKVTFNPFAATPTPPAPPKAAEPAIEDPWFVFGISRGAKENE